MAEQGTIKNLTEIRSQFLSCAKQTLPIEKLKYLLPRIDQHNDLNQMNEDQKLKELSPVSKVQSIKRAGRLAWLGHWLYEPKVAGSSPARPTILGFS